MHNAKEENKMSLWYSMIENIVYTEPQSVINRISQTLHVTMEVLYN